jgi:hypothetical protein
MSIPTVVFCSLLADFPDISVSVRGHNTNSDVNDNACHLSFTSVFVLCPLTLLEIAGKSANKLQNTTVVIPGLPSLHWKEGTNSDKELTVTRY